MDQFRGLFTKLDQNKDGFVSVEELHNEMKKHGILSRDGKVQVIFSKTKGLISIYPSQGLISFIWFPSQNIIDSYDKNQDGLLDYKEFLTYMKDRERKWKIHFHDLDKNKCGKYSEVSAPCYTAHPSFKLYFLKGKSKHPVFALLVTLFHVSRNMKLPKP